jgi:DNA-binding winged helix-turn-helix (wHTH) protein
MASGGSFDALPSWSPSNPRYFDLLAYLIAHRISGAWGGRVVSESAMATCINAVRTAVGNSGKEQRLVNTLHCKGICFVG